MRPRCRWARVLAATSVLVALAPGSGAAQNLREVDLGGGLAVVQRWEQFFYEVRRPIWHPVGFSFGDHLSLGFARGFARVPTMGRIVAVLGGHVLYTDDLGASWHSARWNWRQTANAVAFDSLTSFGVAVGDAGYVWNTHDGGETWRCRRSGAGVVYTHVAVLGRVCVTADSDGNIWRSRDGGSQRNLLTRSRDFSLRTEGDTIVIRTTRRTFLVHRDGRVERRPAVHAR